jgi:hypothetical protein
VLCTSETRCRFVSFLSHDCVPVVDEQSQFGCCQPNRPEPCGEFAVIVYRCRDRAVVLYPLAHSSNAIPDDLYTMMSSRTEGVSVSQSLIIFCLLHLRIHFPSRAHFRAHCMDAISACLKLWLCLVDGYGCPSHIYNIRDFWPASS